MTTSDLRTLLRRDSAVLHATLDKGIGHLTDAADYRRYVLGSHAFRASLEPALSNAEAATGWQPLLLEAELYGDLAALGLYAVTPLMPPPLESEASLIGALYVLEGSSLGAVLLSRQAAVLGFDATRGALHLARQTHDPRRWTAFQHVLQQPNVDRDEACTAARAVFRLALAAFSVSAPATVEVCLDDCR